jgi:hypothetical protein
VHDQIGEAKVAVRDRRFLVRRDMHRHPLDQPVHVGDLLQLRVAVLLGPAPHLPRNVLVGSAEIAEADFAVIN